MSSMAIDTSVGWRSPENSPIGLFGSVMGLTGLRLAWRRAHAKFGALAWRQRDSR